MSSDACWGSLGPSGANWGRDTDTGAATRRVTPHGIQFRGLRRSGGGAVVGGRAWGRQLRRQRLVDRLTREQRPGADPHTAVLARTDRHRRDTYAGGSALGLSCRTAALGRSCRHRRDTYAGGSALSLSCRTPVLGRSCRPRRDTSGGRSALSLYRHRAALGRPCRHRRDTSGGRSASTLCCAWSHVQARPVVAGAEICEAISPGPPRAANGAGN
jgi:hypothetical protein